MRLVELHPRWWAETGRHGQGCSFVCPHCVRAENPQRIGVAFANPLDGLGPIVLTNKVKLDHVHDQKFYEIPPGFHWTRIGDTFEVLTLSPSVNAEASGHWHGFIQNGEVR